MKRYFGCFLWVLLLVFGVAASAPAVTCTNADCAELSIVNGQDGGASQPASVIGDPFYGSGVNAYDANDLNTWFGTSITGGFTEFDGPQNQTSYLFDFTGLSMTYNYLSVKFDGYVALYDIAGCESLNWTSPKQFAWSPPARLWEGTSVPDASVMLLLGSAILGLSIFSRKSKKS